MSASKSASEAETDILPDFRDTEAQSSDPLSTSSPDFQCESLTKTAAGSIEMQSHVDKGVENNCDIDEDMGGDVDEWEFEAEVCESISWTEQEIRGWDVLRDQIKVDLKKKGAALPLSKVNQLLILRNFATLRLKGYLLHNFCKCRDCQTMA